MANFPSYGVNPVDPTKGSTSTNIFGGAEYTGQNPEQAVLDILGSSVGPQLAQGQLQYGLGQQQLGLVGQQFGLQEAYNNAMATNQLGQLGISAQQTGLQQLGLQQQSAQAQAQQQFEQQQYALQSGQYPEQFAEAKLAYQNALMNQQGQQAIGGTMNTVGGKQQASTLTQQYGFQQQDIARAQALSQLGQQSELSGFQYSQQQLQNAQSNLALIAKANGLSQQQAYQMLQYGNQQAGLGAQQNIIGILSGMGNAALGNISALGGALSPIGFASGLNALAPGG